MHNDSNLCTQHCKEDGQLCLAGGSEPSAGIVILIIIVLCPLLCHPDDIDPDILESLITMIQAMFTLVAIQSAIMDGTSQMQQLFAGN